MARTGRRLADRRLRYLRICTSAPSQWPSCLGGASSAHAGRRGAAVGDPGPPRSLKHKLLGAFPFLSFVAPRAAAATRSFRRSQAGARKKSSITPCKPLFSLGFSSASDSYQTLIPPTAPGNEAPPILLLCNQAPVGSLPHKKMELTL